MKVKGLPQDLNRPYDFGPEVLKIDAQFEEIPCTLGVTVEFLDNNVDFQALVLFKNIEGIKVLDEGDLLNFWQGEDLPKDWIWEVVSGGWFDTEKQNDGATTLRTREEEIKEYFVVGESMCVSVMCSGNEQPTVKML